MSQLQPDTNLPPVESVDGFVTDDSMVTITEGIENSLNAFGDAIGNLHGNGDYQYELNRFINNLGSTVGSVIYDAAYPFGEDVTNLSETFNLTDRKYAILSLVADTLVVPTLSLPGYNFVEGFENLANDNDFSIDGRVLYFKKKPTSAFTITYSGNTPTSSNILEQGYRPNLIPNPASPTFTRPTLTINSGRVRVTIPTADAISTGTSLEGQYPVVLSGYLQQFISPSGAITCPLAYISAYKINIGTGVATKITCDAIRIISEQVYELTTGEVIDLDNDVILISISNVGITEALHTAIRELQEHKHDGLDLSTPMLHADLADLIPISSNEDIQYAKSIAPGNNHPEYFHREGYNELDGGTYGNAILGDMFLASTDPTNKFNNTNDPSNRIIFGETSGLGHVIFRNAEGTTDDLEISSASNGIYVSYQHTNAAKVGIRMSSSGAGGSHKMSNKASTNDLLIDSSTGKTVFGEQVAGLQDIEGKNIIFEGATLSDSLTMPTGSDLYLGTIDIGVDDNVGHTYTIVNITDTSLVPGAKIVSAVPFEFNDASATKLTVTNGLLKEGSKIYFGADIIAPASYIESKSNKMVYVSDFSLDIEGSGIRNGINFQKDANKYMTIYTSANDGSVASPADNNGFIEVKGGELYLIRPTDEVITVDTITHSFQNNTGTVQIDDLNKWIRSDLFINKLVSSRLEFGIYNAITSTVDQGGNSNKIIVHSNNGVLFSRDQSEDYAVAVLDKCDITVKDVHADNVIADIITADTSAIQNITIPFGGTFTSFGDANFSAPVTVNNTLSVGSALHTSSIVNTGNISTNSMQVAGNISASTLSILNDVAFAGISSVNATFSSVYVGDKIEFTDPGKEIRMNNGAIIGLQMPSISSPTDVPNKGYVDAEIASATGTSAGGLAAETAARIAADNTKASKNGNASEAFEVGTAVSNNQAVRKEQLDAAISGLGTGPVIATTDTAGIVEKSLIAELIAGTANKYPDATQLVQGLASTFGARGYVKLPDFLGGVVIQWGKETTVTGSTVINLPYAGMANCYAVVGTADQAVVPQDIEYVGFSSVNATNFTANTCYFPQIGGTVVPNGNTFWWIAIGK